MVLRVEHINPFINATMETFSTMVKSEIKPGKIGLVAKEAGPPPDVSGIIGLSGGARGTVILNFPRITALKVVSSFVGSRVLALDDTVTDGIGELANIIAGAAKRNLAQFNIQISLPSVVLGKDYELAGPKDIVPMAVPFQSGLGFFTLVVRFKSGE